MIQFQNDLYKQELRDFDQQKKGKKNSFEYDERGPRLNHPKTYFVKVTMDALFSNDVYISERYEYPCEVWRKQKQRCLNDINSDIEHKLKGGRNLYKHVTGVATLQRVTICDVDIKFALL